MRKSTSRILGIGLLLATGAACHGQENNPADMPAGNPGYTGAYGAGVPAGQTYFAPVPPITTPGYTQPYQRGCSLHRIIEWACYRPHPMPNNCMCKKCNCTCTPPLYTYFLAEFGPRSPMLVGPGPMQGPLVHDEAVATHEQAFSEPQPPDSLPMEAGHTVPQQHIRRVVAIPTGKRSTPVSANDTVDDEPAPSADASADFSEDESRPLTNPRREQSDEE